MTQGTIMAKRAVTFRNPVQRFMALQRQGEIAVVCDLAAVPPNCTIRLAHDNVVLSRVHVTQSGDYFLPLPRVDGDFDVYFVAGDSKETGLLSRTRVHVARTPTPHFALFPLRIRVETGKPLFSKKNHPIVVVLARVSLRSVGPFIPGWDEIFAISASGCTEEMPSARTFQFPVSRAPIEPNGTSELSLDCGTYDLCLALQHPDGGGFLCGTFLRIRVSHDGATVLSNLAAIAPPVAPQVIAPVPMVYAESSGAIRPPPVPDRLLCVVCRDNTIGMKLEPCRHMCLCQGCHAEMTARGVLKECPMCRQAVKGSERVFIP